MLFSATHGGYIWPAVAREVMATLVRRGVGGGVGGLGGGRVSGKWLASPVHTVLCACWCRLFHWGEPVDFGVPTGVLKPLRPHPAGHSPGWRAPRVPAQCYPVQQLSVLRAVSFFFITDLSTAPSETRKHRKTKMKKFPPWPRARDSCGV